MKTSVQLRRNGSANLPRSDLLGGTPSAIVTGCLGPVALFDACQLVAYRIRYRRRTRLFVFRTLEVDDHLAARVPGVQPRVQLLLNLHTSGRGRLVCGLFAYLARMHRHPSSLPDAFYLRVGAALGGRLPEHKILVSLLLRSTEGTTPAAPIGNVFSNPVERLHTRRAGRTR
jgi:hypothetical protein